MGLVFWQNFKSPCDLAGRNFSQASFSMWPFFITADTPLLAHPCTVGKFQGFWRLSKFSLLNRYQLSKKLKESVGIFWKIYLRGTRSLFLMSKRLNKLKGFIGNELYYVAVSFLNGTVTTLWYFFELFTTFSELHIRFFVVLDLKMCDLYFLKSALIEAEVLLIIMQTSVKTWAIEPYMSQRSLFWLQFLDILTGSPSVSYNPNNLFYFVL